MGELGERPRANTKEGGNTLKKRSQVTHVSMTATQGGETVVVEFGTWKSGGAEPETPVLVRMKTCSNVKRSQSPALTVASSTEPLLEQDAVSIDIDSIERVADNFEAELPELNGEGEKGNGSLRSRPKGRVTLVNMTNFQDEPIRTSGRADNIELAGAEKGSIIPAVEEKKKKTRHQRRSNVIGKLREELHSQQESYQEAELIAKNAEKMAKEVVQHSHLQLALMKEALEDAVQAENVAIEGWKISDQTVAQLLSLLREREKLWARAMWKYAYNAVLRGRDHTSSRMSMEQTVSLQEESSQGLYNETWGFVHDLKGSQRRRASKKLSKLESRIDKLMQKMEKTF